MTGLYYQDKLVTLYHGDCREITEWLAADVLVCDPPYGIAYRGVEGGSKWGSNNGEWVDAPICNDHDTRARDDALTMWGGKPALVFGSWKQPRPAGTRAVLIWEKGDHVGMGDLAIPWRPNLEEIYVLGRGFRGRRTTGVLRFNAPSPNLGRRWHPMEKPLSLMGALLSKCPSGAIADPFAGSGSTLVAAKVSGARAIGVELDETHCERAAERLSQPDLFERLSTM